MKSDAVWRWTAAGWGWLAGHRSIACLLVWGPPLPPILVELVQNWYRQQIHDDGGKPGRAVSALKLPSEWVKTVPKCGFQAALAP